MEDLNILRLILRLPLFLLMSFICIHVKGHKKVSDPLKLEVKMVVRSV